MIPTRRDVMQGIAAGTAMLAVGSGVAVAEDHTDSEETKAAKVRVAHASPDAPNVDVFVGDEKVLADVPFTAVSGYLDLPAGTYQVTIAAASDAEEPADAGTVAFQDEVTFEDEVYTVAAIGELNTEVTDEAFRPVVYEDNVGPLYEKVARVNIVHASPDAPAVDVRVVDDHGNTVATVAEHLGFGEASNYVTPKEGTYSVAVFPAGAAEDVDEAVLGPAEVDIEGGQVVTVFAEGFLTAEPTFQLVVSSVAAASFGSGDDEDKKGEKEGDEEYRDEEYRDEEYDDEDEDEEEEDEDDEDGEGH